MLCLSEPVSHLLEQRPSMLQAVIMTGEPGAPPCLQQCRSDATESLSGQEKEVGDKGRQRDIRIICQKQKAAELGNREDSADLPQKPTHGPISPSTIYLFFCKYRKGFGKAISLLYKQDTSSTNMMRAISQGNLRQFTFHGFEEESYISLGVTLICAGTKPD